MRGLRDAVSGFFFTGYSAESLGALRVLLCAGLILLHVDQLANLLSYDLDGPGFYYAQPIWYFEILGIEQHRPLAGMLAYWSILALSVSAGAGLFTRTSLTLLCLLILYAKGARDSVAGDVHHRYLIPIHFLFLLAVSESGRVFSLDAFRARSRASLESWQASWPIRTMQLYCCLFYFAGGVAKLRVSGWSWVEDGARIQELLLERSLRMGEAAASADSWWSLSLWIAHQPELLFGISLLTLAFELSFPALLLLHRPILRAGFLAGALGFHVSNYLLAGVKFLFLPVVYVVFFDWAWLANASRRVTDLRRS